MLTANEKLKNLNINADTIPKHIAIIMDGNGRWAKSKNMPRTLGHRAGVNAIRDVIKTASNIGIKHLSLYAFSTENWKRPEQEISALMKLLIEFLRKEVRELHENQVKINTIGDITRFPENVQDEVYKAKEMTKNNKGLCVNIALNYGSRDEINRAVKNICHKLLENDMNIEDIDEKLIASYLDTDHIPDPDLLIRTGGEYRLSNFLMWQLAYTELWFTNTYWPDFSGDNLIEAISDFQKRQRRFGAI